MNEDEYKVKVAEFIRENKEFVFNNFNDSDFGTPQPSSNIPNNSSNFNNANMLGNNYSPLYQQQSPNNVIPNNSSFSNNQSIMMQTQIQSSQLLGSSSNTNSNATINQNSWTNPMGHHHHHSLSNSLNANYSNLSGAIQQPLSGNNNNYNCTGVDSSMITNNQHQQHLQSSTNNHSTNNGAPFWSQASQSMGGMQSSQNHHSLLQHQSHNTMNNNSNTSFMSSSSHVNQQAQQIPQQFGDSADICMSDVVYNSPPTTQHPNFQASPQPAISSLRRPQLLKANSHNSITFSNCTSVENVHFQTGTLSTCSSSSSLSDLVSTMSNIDLDNDSNNSGMIRRTTSSFSRPPLKKSSSLTAVAQQTNKGIQKKKEQVLSVSTVQSLVSSSLSSSPQQQEMHMPIPQQTSPPYASNRPMFVKSKSHGQISIQLPNQNKLPSLSQVFGEKFFEETRPNNQNQ